VEKEAGEVERDL